MVDLSRASERVMDFVQLKDKVNASLKKHESTKDVVCPGVQRRAGGEDQVKLAFATEQMAKTARQHVQWLQEPRFDQAPHARRTVVSGQGRSSSPRHPQPDGTVTVSKEATKAVAQENGVRLNDFAG